MPKACFSASMDDDEGDIAHVYICLEEGFSSCPDP